MDGNRELQDMPQEGLDMRKNLKEARQGAGMTQKEVAGRLGTSEIGYRQIESGKRSGSIKTWDMLEDLFGVPQRVLREMI